MRTIIGILCVTIFFGCSDEESFEIKQSQLEGIEFSLPVENDFSIDPMYFELTLSGAESNNGTVSITLDSSLGVPSYLSSFNDLRILASTINNQIFNPVHPQTAVGLVADAIDIGGGNYQILFTSEEPGFSQVIQISNESSNCSEIGIYSSLVSMPGE